MKTLKFKGSLVASIVKGTKRSTWRLFDDKDLQVGDMLRFVNSETGAEFSRGEITALREKTLQELGEEDYTEGHERYKDQSEMLRAYRKYYGEAVGLHSTLKIVKFRILS